MRKEELLKLESIDWRKEIPLLNEIYVISTARKHESGYKKLAIYGVKWKKNSREIEWAKKLCDFSDVVHFQLSKNVVDEYGYPINVDYEEVNVARYFTLNRDICFEITHCMSDCDVKVVKEESK